MSHWLSLLQKRSGECAISCLYYRREVVSVPLVVSTTHIYGGWCVFSLRVPSRQDLGTNRESTEEMPPTICAGVGGGGRLPNDGTYPTL